MPVELLATVVRELAHFGEGPRIAVLLARPSQSATTQGGNDCNYADADARLVGPAEPTHLDPGTPYIFYGDWKDHPKHGRQFRFISFARTTPHGRRGVTQFLQDVRGIGPKLSAAIWSAFGPDCLELIRTDPAAIVARVRSVSLETLERAAASLAEIDHERAVRIELYDLLDGRGFPKSLPAKCIDAWGNAAPAMIRDNPFRLMQFARVGFVRADNLYLDLGGDPCSPERQIHLVKYLVEADNSGSVWLSVADIESKFKAKLSAERMDFRGALVAAEQRQYVDCNYLPIGTSERGETVRGEVVASWRDAQAERIIADRVETLLAEDHSWPSADAVTEIEPEQRAALAKATSARLGIICGPPGTGKTRVLARLIRHMQICGEINYVVAAPTGKAARRITEVMQTYGIVKPAITIHRLLGVEKYDNNDGYQFAFRAGNPLPHKWVFIDEPSMVDVRLMAALLAAVPDTCHILMAGDVNQLPPVGRGAPLRDLLAADIPCGELSTIHRNGGRIVQACREIIERQRFTPSLALNIHSDPPENLAIFGEGTAARQIARCEHFIQIARDAGGRNPKWDIQLICAVNKGSKVSRRALNAHFQDVLNPNGQRVDGNPFRVGDKVVNRENSWPKMLEVCDARKILQEIGKPELAAEYAAGFGEAERNENGEVWVANGDIGEVLAVAKEGTVVWLEGPMRVVRIPRSAKAKEGANRGGKTKWTDGEGNEGGEGGEGEAGGGGGGKLELAYAISGHLSQGSQWPYVIVFLDGCPGSRMVTSRNWLYTAISRAELACVLIGKRETAMDMCQRDAMAVRRTGLVERIERNRRNAAV